MIARLGGNTGYPPHQLHTYRSSSFLKHTSLAHIVQRFMPCIGSVQKNDQGVSVHITPGSSNMLRAQRCDAYMESSAGQLHGFCGLHALLGSQHHAAENMLSRCPRAAQPGRKTGKSMLKPVIRKGGPCVQSTKLCAVNVKAACEHTSCSMQQFAHSCMHALHGIIHRGKDAPGVVANGDQASPLLAFQHCV